jgi:hypothetical protein
MRIKKNGKVINLTESDLRRIVTKVIKEQESDLELKSGNFEIAGNDGKKRKLTIKGTQKLNKETNKEYVVYYAYMDGKHIPGPINSNGKIPINTLINIGKKIGGFKGANNIWNDNVKKDLFSKIGGVLGVDVSLGN